MEINYENHRACIARIMARGSIGKEEARALLEAVGEKADEMRRTGSTNPLVDAAWEMANKLKDDAAGKKIDAIRNARTRLERDAEITDGMTTKLDAETAVSRAHGSLYWQPGTEDKKNVETMWRSLTHGWLSAMHAQFEKAGFLKVAAAPEMFREIAKELWDLRSGMATVLLPSNSPARQIAQTIFNLQEAMRLRLNGAGAKIADARDWIATTAHDEYLMRRGGRGEVPAADAAEAYTRWRDYVLPRLDEKTFADVVPRAGDLVTPGETMEQARDRFLRGVFNALYTGEHIKTRAEPGGTGPAFEGSYNIARSISQGRVLRWKDSDAWSDYMTKYGKSQDWYSLMSHAATKAGRDASLMEMWGTNPHGNLNLVMQRIAARFRDTDPDGVVKFKQLVANSSLFKHGARPALDSVMARLDGTASIATNEMAATIMSTVRQFYDMAYLGFVAGTHAGSLIGTFPSESRWFGINAFSSLGNLIKAMVPDGMKEAERLDVLEQLGAYGEGVSREAYRPFARGDGTNSPGWGVPGYIGAAHNRFMKATGLPYLFDHAKRGMREMIANKLGRELGNEFSTLAPKLQQTLRAYGIDENAWTLLREGELTRTPSGKVYLTPYAAKTIDEGAVEASLRARGILTGRSSPDAIANAIKSTKQDLADRLAMLYEDGADHSVVTSGVRQQAFLQGNSPRGSWQSEVLAGLTQFRVWPIAAMHQLMGQTFYQSMSKTDAALGVGMVAGLSMLGGYFRMTARDLAYGDQPRVPRTVGEAGKVALAALAQGGGLGIAGDWLFGDLNRMGASTGASLLGGPMLTDASRLMEIYNRYTQSIGTTQKADLWPELARFGIGHLPFANLFYVKQMSDYLLWFHMYEAMKPGWYDRTNRQMLQHQGRAMIGYHPGGQIPYLPPMLGIGAH